MTTGSSSNGRWQDSDPAQPFSPVRLPDCHVPATPARHNRRIACSAASHAHGLWAENRPLLLCRHATTRRRSSPQAPAHTRPAWRTEQPALCRQSRGRCPGSDRATRVAAWASVSAGPFPRAFTRGRMPFRRSRSFRDGHHRISWRRPRPRTGEAAGRLPCRVCPGSALPGWTSRYR
jgi:hypothetical protein